MVLACPQPSRAHASRAPGGGRTSEHHRQRVARHCSSAKQAFTIAAAFSLRGPSLQALSRQGSFDPYASPPVAHDDPRASCAAARGDRRAAPDAFPFRLSRPPRLSQSATLRARSILKRMPTREGRTSFAAKPFPTRTSRSFQTLPSLVGNNPVFSPMVQACLCPTCAGSRACRPGVSRR